MIALAIALGCSSMLILGLPITGFDSSAFSTCVPSEPVNHCIFFVEGMPTLAMGWLWSFKSSFVLGILHVVLARSNNQMVWIDTGRLVAFVHHIESIWNRASKVAVRYSMRFINLSVNRHRWILCFCAPYPAAVNLNGVLPKSVGYHIPSITQGIS